MTTCRGRAEVRLICVNSERRTDALGLKKDPPGPCHRILCSVKSLLVSLSITAPRRRVRSARSPESCSLNLVVLQIPLISGGRKPLQLEEARYCCAK